MERLSFLSANEKDPFAKNSVSALDCALLTKPASGTFIGVLLQLRGGLALVPVWVPAFTS
jgi:hypothetical protein